MNTSKRRDLPAGLEGVRRRFERWRRSRRGHARIPDALWAAAVKAAGMHGLHRTVRALRLDYYSLKERVEQQAGTVRDPVARAAAGRRRPSARKRSGCRGAATAQSLPAFLELAPPFRKGIDGLARVCKEVLQRDPFGGWLFVFRNRPATAVKLWVYDGQGFWLFHKRLSSGRFRWWPASDTASAKTLAD